MQINEKEMNLEDVEKELSLTKEEYYNIYSVDFSPVNKRFHIIFILLNTLFFTFIITITYIPTIGAFIAICFAFLWIPLISSLLSRPYYLLKKFELSNFSIDDLNAIKSNPFLFDEFKKSLIDNNTAVSSKFSKIGINYRNELKKKIEHLSTQKENLERDAVIESML
jgi:hypothetical protein